MLDDTRRPSAEVRRLRRRSGQPGVTLQGPASDGPGSEQLSEVVIGDGAVEALHLHVDEPGLARVGQIHAAARHDGRDLDVHRPHRPHHPRQSTTRQAEPVDAAGDTPDPENAEGPETKCFRAFQVVAGAGFEPATFGL